METVAPKKCWTTARHSTQWSRTSSAPLFPSNSSSVSCSFASLQLCIEILRSILVRQAREPFGFFCVRRESRAQLADGTPNAFLHRARGTVHRARDLFVRHAFVVAQQKRESLRRRQLGERANHILKK